MIVAVVGGGAVVAVVGGGVVVEDVNVKPCKTGLDVRGGPGGPGGWPRGPSPLGTITGSGRGGLWKLTQ